MAQSICGHKNVDLTLTKANCGQVDAAAAVQHINQC